MVALITAFIIVMGMMHCVTDHDPEQKTKIFEQKIEALEKTVALFEQEKQLMQEYTNILEILIDDYTREIINLMGQLGQLINQLEGAEATQEEIDRLKVLDKDIQGLKLELNRNYLEQIKDMEEDK